jgi:ethanolamine utilization microcompartment shell protein EutL
MSDKKISELAVGILTPNSIIPVVIDNTVRTDLTDLVTYLKPRIDTNFTGAL